ncbi:MAG: threonylcarbamoyl-AMP synthase [Nanoarchaeota archaeon]|nr:threonylcarbamoyl-AMP synthase [Nanoarchaeota archaeon]
MTKIFDKENFDLNFLKENSVFIYPTDTIYGIGCDATNEEAVKRIRDIKNRDKNPFSVIAPSKEWILKNCVVDEKWLNKLPGPYTLILKLKNKNCVAFNVSFSNTLGVRIPDHWFNEVVKKINKPIITTSVNKSGEKFMSSIESLDESIKGKIDFIIYEGEKISKPSTLIDLSKDKIEIKKRD